MKFKQVNQHIIEVDDIEYHVGDFNISWAQDPKIILEFGSYDGGDALRYKYYYPNAEIYSIEADTDLYNNIRHLKKYNISLYNYAMCDYTGTIGFHRIWDDHINGLGPASSIYKPKETFLKEFKFNHAHDKITVPATTVCDFCAGHGIAKVDIMHVDVEGAFNRVLQGLGDIRPTIIYAEVVGNRRHGDMARKDALTAMSNLGYKLEHTSGADLMWRKQ